MCVVSLMEGVRRTWPATAVAKNPVTSWDTNQDSPASSWTEYLSEASLAWASFVESYPLLLPLLLAVSLAVSDLINSFSISV